MTTHDDPSTDPAVRDPDDAIDAVDPPAPRRTVLRVLREGAIVIVAAVVVSALIRAFLGQMFVIPSASMENTLLIGDRILVSKISDVHRGNVVVFADPGGDWLGREPVAAPGPVDRALQLIGVPTAGTPGYLVKRVIGTPGDTVVCCDDSGRMTVNGTPLDEAAYLYTDPGGLQVAPSDVRFKVVVPADRLFVMGDNRDNSLDSRCHLSDSSPGQGVGQVAFVPVKLVVGPAYAILSPFGRATVLRIPSTFGAVPAPTSPAPAEGTISPVGVKCY